MKKRLTFIMLFWAMSATVGCKEGGGTVNEGEDMVFPRNDKVVYAIDGVSQSYGTGSVDLLGEFDFFKSVKLTVWFDDQALPIALEFDNGEAPFLPFTFAAPEGKVDCTLDNSAEPAKLLVKETGDVICLLADGELRMDFTIDNPLLSYRYTFRNVK